MYGFDTIDYDRENDYAMDNNEAEPIFFNSYEMTTFPRYDSHPVAWKQTNRQAERFSPYRGYFEDMRAVTAKCNQEPAPNLINSYLKKSWVEHDQGERKEDGGSVSKSYILELIFHSVQSMLRAAHLQ